MIDDARERKIALDPKKSFIVEAPAGSGKTSLLVARYLSLLVRADVPEEILAITFTKKAAFEMKDRIFKALKTDFSLPSLSEYQKILKNLVEQVLLRDQECGWSLKENINRLRIQTIDSFNSYLAKRLPILSRAGNNLNLVEGAGAFFYYRLAVQELFKNLEHDSNIARPLEKILLHLNNDYYRLENLLVGMLAKREQWLPYVISAGLAPEEELRQRLEHDLKSLVQEKIADCFNNLPRESSEELFSLAKYAWNNLKVLTNKDLGFLENRSKFSNDFQDFLLWKELADLLLTKQEKKFRQMVDRRNGFPTDKKIGREEKNAITALLEQFTQYPLWEKSLDSIAKAPLPYYGESEWEVLKNLLQLLRFAAGFLQVVFNEYQVSDYQEISLAALRALGDESNPSSVLLQLDYQIKHLLIDEFQDTSLAQFYLLEKIVSGWNGADGRTVFLVGDPRQSIYRFREAEVGLFLKVKKAGLGNLRLFPITLTTNFRSVSSLIDWINQGFQKIMPEKDNLAESAISFSSSVPAPENMVVNNDAVDFAILINGTEQDVAREVIARVKKIIEKNSTDKIAILVRARTHLDQIIPLLKKEQITYQALDLEKLSGDQIIQDLLSLTRALLDPADRVAWLAILRAPWCGLNLFDLHEIAKDDEKTIGEVINHPELLKISVEGKNILIHFVSVWDFIRSKQTSLRVCELIRLLWSKLSGKLIYPSEADFKKAEIFFDLLERSEQEKSGFDLIELITKKIEDQYLPQETNNCNLQITTIHKAKGLEFDHVILPHLERETRSDNKDFLLWSEELTCEPRKNNRLFLAPLPPSSDKEDEGILYQYLRDLQKEKNEHELVRLLYVAMTRAKKSLTIVATGRDSSLQAEVEPTGPLKKLWPLKSDDWFLKTNSNLAVEEKKSRKIKRLIIDKKLDLEMLMPREEEIVDYQATSLGEIIHAALEKLASELKVPKGEREIVQYLEKQISFWKSLLWRFEIGENEIFLEKIKSAIKNILSDRRGQWILEKHEQAENEYQISGIFDDQIFNYRIDRTFICDGARWIIDYKTTTSDFAVDQYREQLQKYAQLFGKKENLPIKLGVYFPLAPEEWKEWAYL
jgi:ATP-dependent helicase/nuclease subunit A